MNIEWTKKAAQDILHLHNFLARHNPVAAARVVHGLITAPDKLAAFPRLGEALVQYQPREVRRLFVGDYEMRYEIARETIYVLRIWHNREYRTED